jgi:hypothetical protein
VIHGSYKKRLLTKNPNAHAASELLAVINQ